MQTHLQADVGHRQNPTGQEWDKVMGIRVEAFLAMQVILVEQT